MISLGCPSKWFDQLLHNWRGKLEFIWTYFKRKNVVIRCYFSSDNQEIFSPMECFFKHPDWTMEVVNVRLTTTRNTAGEDHFVVIVVAVAIIISVRNDPLDCTGLFSTTILSQFNSVIIEVFLPDRPFEKDLINVARLRTNRMANLLCQRRDRHSLKTEMIHLVNCHQRSRFSRSSS